MEQKSYFTYFCLAFLPVRWTKKQGTGNMTRSPKIECHIKIKLNSLKPVLLS